jgi:antitoxin ParD1/3/4
MSRETSFILGEYFDQLIEAEMQSGRYSTASEVVREALRLFEQQQVAIQRLSDAVDEGFESGFADEIDWDNLAQRSETGKRGIGN